MGKIAIVVNQKKASAAELFTKLSAWLAKRDVQVADTLSAPIENVLQGAELVICLGGDGTLLSVAAHMKTHSVPVLGVNLGSLGFLTEIKQEEIFEELNAYFLGQARIEERLMLACSARSEKHKKERRLVALNDIVISREGLSRMLQIEVRVSGDRLTNFSGDGLILATPTGSTAYSLSAGGAVVHPKLEALVITPICAHTSALRSLVVSGGEKVSVKIVGSGNVGGALLTADGQENLEIDDSYIVEITRSGTPLRLVKSSKRGYIATLREVFAFPG